MEQRRYNTYPPILAAARALQDASCPTLIAVEGRCGSGKSALAQAIGADLVCPVFHMDDFFLPPRLRTQARLAHPGGNVHYERARGQLLEPFLAGRPIRFRPWDCRDGRYGPPIFQQSGALAVVEGSYALHPALADCYTLRIFVTCDPEVQRQRLLEREGVQRMEEFLLRWIPLEEAYFSASGLPEGCDFVLDTSGID